MAAVEGYQNQAQNETQGMQGQQNAQAQQNMQENDSHTSGSQTQSQQERQPQATAGIPGKDDERKLFVGGLSRNTTDKELRDHFGKFGEIESISVKVDPHTGISRGFAFMVFTNPKTIDKLLASGEHYINKRKVRKSDIVEFQTKNKHWSVQNVLERVVYVDELLCVDSVFNLFEACIFAVDGRRIVSFRANEYMKEIQASEYIEYRVF